MSEMEKQQTELQQEGALQEDVQNEALREVTAWDRVEAARNPARPTAKQLIEHMVDGFFELHGDRRFGDDPAIVGGVGYLGGIAVTVIGEDKGATTQEKARNHFGCPHPEGYRKALRLMKQAEKFGRPVICLVDTQGAYCGVGAEERGQGQAIAENLMVMSRLKVPVISVVIGEGGSGGALALAVADRVAMLENAVYSILSPEGFSSILWKDASRAKEAAELMRMTAEQVRALGVVEDVIGEPEGDAQGKPGETAAIIKEYVLKNLRPLMELPARELVGRRYERFRAIGAAEASRVN